MGQRETDPNQPEPTRDDRDHAEAHCADIAGAGIGLGRRVTSATEHTTQNTTTDTTEHATEDTSRDTVTTVFPRRVASVRSGLTGRRTPC